MTFAMTGKIEQNSLHRCVILCESIPPSRWSDQRCLAFQGQRFWTPVGLESVLSRCHGSRPHMAFGFDDFFSILWPRIFTSSCATIKRHRTKINPVEITRVERS